MYLRTIRDRYVERDEWAALDMAIAKFEEDYALSDTDGASPATKDTFHFYISWTRITSGGFFLMYCSQQVLDRSTSHK
jgi:hypothetical protein